jgi:hypothetical protein
MRWMMGEEKGMGRRGKLIYLVVKRTRKKIWIEFQHLD